MAPRPRPCRDPAAPAVRPGKRPRQRLLDAFGALADRIERRAAAAANLRHRLPCAPQWWQRSCCARAMQRHARIAMRARRDPAAGAAQQSRRVAAPVQEHDHLSAGCRCRPIACSAGCDSPCSHACLRRSTSRRRGACAAPRARGSDSARSGLRGVLERFQRRRRRAQHDRHLRALRAHAPPGRAPSSESLPAACRRRRAPRRRRSARAAAARRRPPNGCRCMMRASPACAARQASRRAASLSAGMQHREPALKRPRKRSTSCGVSPISGTSTSAWPPAASAAAITRR